MIDRPSVLSSADFELGKQECRKIKPQFLVETGTARSAHASHFYRLFSKSDFLSSCFPDSKYLPCVRVLRGGIKDCFGEAVETSRRAACAPPPVTAVVGSL